VTLRTSVITIRGRGFTVSELTAKQMSDVRKVMKDAPHDLDITVAALGCSDPVMTRAELAAEPEPLDVAALRRRFGQRISDEELLLRFGMPGAEVDAMIAAGPAVTHYNPDLVPVLKLLRELGRRPAARELTVEKPGFLLSLKGRSS